MVAFVTRAHLRYLSPNCVLMYGVSPASWHFRQYSSHKSAMVTPGFANSRWMYG